MKKVFFIFLFFVFVFNFAIIINVYASNPVCGLFYKSYLNEKESVDKYLEEGDKYIMDDLIKKVEGFIEYINEVMLEMSKVLCNKTNEFNQIEESKIEYTRILNNNMTCKIKYEEYLNTKESIDKYLEESDKYSINDLIEKVEGFTDYINKITSGCEKTKEFSQIKQNKEDCIKMLNNTICRKHYEEYLVNKENYDNLIITEENNRNINSLIAILNKSVFFIDNYISKMSGYCTSDSNEFKEKKKDKENYSKKLKEVLFDNQDNIKTNGIIKGFCYVIRIIKGPFGKGIFSIFIILLGMSMLSGNSSAVSPKTFISIALALALIFGSAQLADTISGNKYSCELFGL